MSGAYNSRRHMAREMGFTENAVLGKIWRWKTRGVTYVAREYIKCGSSIESQLTGPQYELRRGQKAVKVFRNIFAAIRECVDDCVIFDNLSGKIVHGNGVVYDAKNRTGIMIIPD